MIETIAAAVDERTARGIAGAVSRLVMAGDLAGGTRLPTVREIAQALGTSPTTVSQAWRTLARAGVIAPRGRAGTFVLDGMISPQTGPRRYRRITRSPGRIPRDYSTGTPDPALLPDLAPMLARVARSNLTTSYLDDPVLPALEAALRPRWPFEPQAVTVVDGAMDALDRLTGVLVGYGSRVLVENPSFPPLLDLLELVGAQPVGLAMDDEGIRPAALRDALDSDPVALYLQPRAQNPTGTSTTPGRAAELAALLAGRDLVVIEDDHVGDVSSVPPVSLGSHLPASTVHIRSFSKSHGPDLRLAAVGGVASVIEAVANRRLLGPGWSSRLLQAVLAELLVDPATEKTIAAARAAYAERRQRMVASLAARGVRAQAADGINMWVEVSDEQVALVALAARGVGAAPGTPFEVSPLDGDHLRVTVGLIAEESIDMVADVLAHAAHG